MEDNSYAGQGSVLLDIGGDVGALIVTMPTELAGVEIEIRPVGYTEHIAHNHGHDHDGHDHHHANGGGHAGPVHLPHVAVIGRPVRDGLAYTAVFPELIEGAYELYERPHGPVRLRTTVSGGSVQHETWPSD